MTSLGRFEVVEALDWGGPCAAFVARDPTLGRLVMVRVVDAPGGDELRREAMVQPHLEQVGVLTVHEVCRDDAGALVIYEHVAMRPLSSWLRDHRGAAGVVTACVSSARALAAIHASETVHGALDLHSLGVDSQGRARIVDLGLAAIAGRPRAAAPEEDQRALCAAWLDALAVAGARPPRAIRAALERGARTEAAQRWPSAAALADALEHGGRSRTAPVAIAAIAAGAAVTGGLVLWQTRGDGDPAAPASPPTPPPAVAATPVALVGFAGCSDAPQFADDDTVVFAHRGDRKAGLYAVERSGGAPRWLYDGPGAELATQWSGTPGTVLFMVPPHIETLDLDGVRTRPPSRFDWNISGFVAGGPDGVVYFIGTTGRGLYRFANERSELLISFPPGEVIWHIGISPDGRHLVLSGGRGLYLIDTTTIGASQPEAVPLPTKGTAYQRAAVATGGAVLYYPGRAGIVRFEPATAAEHLLVPGASASGGLTLSPDGRTLVWSDCRTRAAVTDVSGAAPRELFRDSLQWPGVGPDGSFLFARELPSGTVAARRTPDGRVIELSDLGLGNALTPAMSPDGAQIAFTVEGVAPGIYVAPADGSAPPRMVAADGVHYPMWLPDGRLAFARADATGSIRLWAMPDGGGEATIVHPRSRRLADVIRATGEVLLVDGGFSNLWRWDPATGVETPVALPPELAAAGVALGVVRASPDGKTALVTPGMFDQVWRIDLSGSGAPAELLRQAEISGIAGAVYTPDGHPVVVENTPGGGLWRLDML